MSPGGLRTIVGGFAHRTVVVVGDLLVDEYLFGRPARISREGNGGFYLRDGVFTGRMQVDTLVKSLAYFRTGPAVCDDPQFQLIKQTACGMADTVAPAANDFLGYDCNGLSMAVQFEAEPAQIGIVRDERTVEIGAEQANFAVHPLT